MCEVFYGPMAEKTMDDKIAAVVSKQLAVQKKEFDQKMAMQQKELKQELKQELHKQKTEYDGKFEVMDKQFDQLYCREMACRTDWHMRSYLINGAVTHAQCNSMYMVREHFRLENDNEVSRRVKQAVYSSLFPQEHIKHWDQRTKMEKYNLVLHDLDNVVTMIQREKWPGNAVAHPSPNSGTRSAHWTRVSKGATANVQCAKFSAHLQASINLAGKKPSDLKEKNMEHSKRKSNGSANQCTISSSKRPKRAGSESSRYNNTADHDPQSYFRDSCQDYIGSPPRRVHYSDKQQNERQQAHSIRERNGYRYDDEYRTPPRQGNSSDQQRRHNGGWAPQSQSNRHKLHRS